MREVNFVEVLEVLRSRRSVRSYQARPIEEEKLLRILEAGRIGATYVIGGSCERTNLQVVRDICGAVDRALGRPDGSAEQLITRVEDRPGHDRRYAIDASKIRSELGWRPSHDLHTTLPTVVDWYLRNREWTKRVRSGEYRNYYRRQYGDRPQQPTEIARK